MKRARRGNKFPIMNKLLSVFFPAALIAALLPISALASHATSAADRSFVMQAAMGGSGEVREGRIQSRSSDRNAGMFGRRMVQDHTKVNLQLQTLAQELGLNAQVRAGIAKAPPAAAMAPAEYLSHEVSDHQTTIALFEREARSGSNPNLRAFARMTLPLLRTHLALAQRLSSTP